VDDDEDARRLNAAYLAEEQIEVRTAADGLEGLELLKKFSPDAVILDLMMPRMDGLSFLDAMRADSRCRHIPVVIITAKVLTPEETRRLDNQAQSVLKKTEVLEEDLKCVLQELFQPPADNPPDRSGQPLDSGWDENRG
jgi:CheY-like chemotaxis protein